MSNFFERRALEDDCAPLALRLLAAISGECGRLAMLIEQAGQKLAEEGQAYLLSDWVQNLQQFDRLSQHAQSQARLQAFLVCNAGQPMHRRDLVRAIQDVPLPDVRQRLLRAIDEPVGFAPQAQVVTSEGEGDCLFYAP